MRIDTWAGSEGESCSCGNLNHIQGIYSGFPLASHLALPGSESIFGLSPDPPVCVCVHLLAKMNPVRRPVDR